MFYRFYVRGGCQKTFVALLDHRDTNSSVGYNNELFRVLQNSRQLPFLKNIQSWSESIFAGITHCGGDGMLKCTESFSHVAGATLSGVLSRIDDIICISDFN